MANNKVLLIILDGWGLSPEEHSNAPLLAKTPVLDHVYATYPKTSLSASGLEVGLNPGEPGNSEVGHMNIGSGRVVYENLPRVDQAIESKEFFSNKELLAIAETVKKNNSSLHLVGLVSDGGVHAHIRHLEALLDFAKQQGIKDVKINFIADGRDTPPQKALEFAEKIEKKLAEIGGGRIVSLVGRYFAMDRDKNWDRAKKAFNLFARGEGEKFSTVKEAVDANYNKKKYDEFLEPSVIGEPTEMKSGDGVILFNYRSDRMIQLLHLFIGEQSSGVPAGLKVITMVEYEKEQKIPSLFAPINLNNTLSEIISSKKLTQFHTAETEKYAHVTYFFKAGKEEPFPGETDKVVPSKKVSTYDKLPIMSAPEVTGEVLKAIKSSADFIVVNFANGDMVGHTGVLAAAILACQEIDNCLQKVLAEASAQRYKVFITADHGNCETMIDELTKQPNTEHTSNPVPFVYLDLAKQPFDLNLSTFATEDYIQFAAGTPVGVLADIAPSICANLSIEKPGEMSGMDLTVAMQ